jgi:hypothetical protein
LNLSDKQHVTKQHDDPYLPRPLADLSQHLPPSIPIPSQPIPEIAHTDELTTLTVLGTSHRSTFHQEKARHKVQTGCFAGEDPVIHVEHPPHILEVLEHSASVPTSADIPLSTELIIGKEERLLYKVLGRKRRLEVFVELPMRRIKVEA